ncbi:MAG TPA: ribosome-associated translation inhibitor RaiA [Clostridiales bacterium]|nr:ribosome-associated translation inhibitor RaiA [Clostridiales bacterium]
MKLEILARNCEVSDKLKRITENKLEKLDKYFGEDEPSAKVVFKKEGQLLTTEVMLSYAGKFVRAAASGDNFYDDLDVVLPKLEGQIRKYRTRFDKHNKNNAYKTQAEFSGEKTYEEKKTRLVKEKKFALSPMTVDEAIEEMELLGHSFYVFREAKSNTVQVLYARNDGDLALIETDGE